MGWLDGLRGSGSSGASKPNLKNNSSSSFGCVEENFHQLALSPPELAALCALIRAERGTK